MSDQIGEAYVRVRADVSTFKQEAQQGVTSAVRSVEDQAKVEMQGALQEVLNLPEFQQGIQGGIQDLQTRAGNVRTLFGFPVSGRDLREARAIREEAETLAKGLREVQEISGATNLAPLAASADAVAASVRRAGSGVGAMGLRLGLFGVAATTGYRAMTEISNSLRVTGEDAFTTEGRIRNLGAELVKGDLIGGFKALAAQPETFKDLGLEIYQVQKILRDAGDEADELRKTFESGIFGDAWKEAIQLADAASTAEASLQALLEASETLKQSTSGGFFTTGVRPDDLGGLQGVGAVDVSNDLRGGAGGRALLPEGPTDKLTIAQIYAQMDEDLRNDLRLAKVEAQRAAETVKRLQEQRIGRGRLGEAKKALAAAELAVYNIEQQIDAQQKQKADQAAADKKAAADEAARALRASIGAEEQRLQNRRDRARFTENVLRDDRAALVALRNFYREQSRNDNLTLSERRSYESRRIAVAQELLALGKGGEDAQSREQILQLQLQLAEGTRNIGKDNRVALVALRNFYQEQLRDVELTAEERLQYRLKLQQTKDQLRDPREKLGIREQLLQNQLSLARLSDQSTTDDKAALTKLRDFYKAQTKNMKLSLEERLRYESQRIAVVGQLKNLDKTLERDVGLTAFDIFKTANEIFTGFASDIALSNLPGGAAGFSGFSGPKPGLQVGAAVEAGEQMFRDSPGASLINALDRNTEALTAVKDKVGTTVNVQQQFQDPTQDRAREARLARWAVRAAFDG